jgi:hypothetical protein
MLGVVATLKVKPGMEREFEAVAKELVAKVNANEPGCRLYALHRSAYRAAGTTIIGLEEAVRDRAYARNPDLVWNGERTFLQQLTRPVLRKSCRRGVGPRILPVSAARPSIPEGN